MLNFKIITKSGSTFYVYKFGRNQQLSILESEELSKNNIPGFIPVKIVNKRKGGVLFFNTTGFIPVNVYLKNPLSREMFIKLLQSFVSAMDSVHNRYLLLSNMVLDFNYVFVNTTNSSLAFIYLPVSGFVSEFKDTDCINKLIKRGNFTNSDKDYLRELNSIVNSPSGLSYIDLKEYINSYLYSKHKKAGNTSEKQNASAFFPLEKKQSKIYKPEKVKNIGSLKGAFLLKRENTGELVRVTRDGFKMGKNPSCDYSVKGNSSVSNYHLYFNFVGAKLMVTDNNSTNKTFLNGKMLKGGEAAAIKSGDVLLLADEKFIAV